MVRTNPSSLRLSPVTCSGTLWLTIMYSPAPQGLALIFIPTGGGSGSEDSPFYNMLLRTGIHHSEEYNV